MDQLKEEQFVELYNRYYERVFCSALKYLKKDRGLASDMTQETFRRLYSQNFSEIGGYVEKWLFLVCRNLCLKFTRRNNRYWFDENMGEEDIDEHPNPLETCILKEDVALMMECLPKLTANQRKVIHLRFFQNESYASISKKAKMSGGNVGFQLNKAIAKLKHEMTLQKKREDLAKRLS
jgi:RNA polymerase sigma-70 factor (ECF subfamily)